MESGRRHGWFVAPMTGASLSPSHPEGGTGVRGSEVGGQGGLAGGMSA